MKRAFVVTYGLPGPTGGGGNIRVFHLMRQLAWTHDIFLLAVVDSAWQQRPDPSVTDLCRDVRTVPYEPFPGEPPIVGRSTWYYRWHNWSRALSPWVPPRRLAVPPPSAACVAVRDALVRRSFDVVLVEQVETMALLPRRARDLPIVLDLWDVLSRVEWRAAWAEQRPGVRALRLVESVKLGLVERRLARPARCTIAVSPSDQRAAALLYWPTPCVLLPNGVDPGYYESVPRHAADPVIGFVGGLSYPPNDAAVRWLGEVIYPEVRAQMPKARLLIVGHSPSAAVRRLGEQPGITVTGYVADVRPYLAEMAVVVVPLRSGGGTRLKILEAAAARRPVVATSAAADGLTLTDGEAIVIADDSQALIEHTVRLLRDADRRRQLAAAARGHVRRHYDWRGLTPALGQAMQRVVQQGQPAASVVPDAVRRDRG